jgi:GNAT superfamily N-acetyltransferase
VIVEVAELEVDASLARALTGLLRACFADYPERSYFKLPPAHRLLAYDGGEVVGHLGCGVRVVRVGAEVFRTVAIEDVCVHPSARGRGVATSLLTAVTAARADFAILFADDDRVYARNGWVRASNPVTWLKVHEHRTLGLTERTDTGALMVKPLGERPWPTGDVDLLGHLF